MPPRRAYRIGDSWGKYPVFSAAGAVRSPGRWHTLGQEVIYGSVHYSTALLEARAYAPACRPTSQRFVEIDIGNRVSCEELIPADLPGWDKRESEAARTFGSLRIKEQRTAILLVPCVIAPMDYNVLLNPNHPLSCHWSVSEERIVRWDERLF